MKKKPPLQKVLDNISNYTHDDIDDLRGGAFPKWIKTELKKIIDYEQEYINRGNKTADEAAIEIANKMVEASLNRNSKH